MPCAVNTCIRFLSLCLCVPCKEACDHYGVNLQEIDELLGQNLTQEDEDAIAEELESILLVRNTSFWS